MVGKITVRNMMEVLQYYELSHWGVSQPQARTEQMGHYGYYALGELLHRVMEPVIIDDHQIYTRLTIKTDGAGVGVRKKRGQPEKIAGKDIGRKNQFVVHKGQMVVSSIDARNGAVGIVPVEADGCVVTDNFWVFKVEDSLVIPSFLQRILTRPAAKQKILEKSHGTTNRLYITLDDFLNVSVPIPDMVIQREVLEKLIKLDNQVQKLQEEVVGYPLQRDAIIEKYIGQMPSKETGQGCLITMDYQDLQKWSFDSNTEVSTNSSTVKMRDCLANFMEQEGASLRVPPMVITSKAIRYIGMDAVEKETGLLIEENIKTQDAVIKSSSLKVPSGYVIYGKLRPYLNKFWKNEKMGKNAICSSEFVVFKPSDRLDQDYFLAILGSPYIQRQIERKVSGARMPRLSPTDFLNLDVPEPDKVIQESIGEAVIVLREEIVKKKKAILKLTGKQKEKLFISFKL